MLLDILDTMMKCTVSNYIFQLYITMQLMKYLYVGFHNISVHM